MLFPFRSRDVVFEVVEAEKKKAQPGQSAAQHVRDDRVSEPPCPASSHQPGTGDRGRESCGSRRLKRRTDTDADDIKKQDDQTATGVLFFPWSTSAFSRDQADSNIKCTERDRQQQYWGSKGLVAPASTLQVTPGLAPRGRDTVERPLPPMQGTAVDQATISQFESGESDGEKLEAQAGESAAR